MMIVDLIDEVDFKEKMLGVGAPVKDCQTLEEVIGSLNLWINDAPQNLSVIQSACIELEATGATILPDVHIVIKDLLALER
ncbi:hypothetical protein [Marinomonas atlantica]|uniref:hypothetical protein n=1 Tax=Marinomonas atlantica TaxID=1806668 RepID=UPI00082CC25F|nr:hypothetical protein [Marinomonas atlantica]MCO4785656.1 hypothetical protein [Marinomonas atlantica]